eukprot:TRINITY_DN1023_c0_g1_i1.p1 TRINITY_DN1023_c0_g1~~TRINITY_DN1023_c0_g1_i1.p1  ORF type:complete len:583 (+),score=107.20 TRINITY_DN1023_c0_g1_i1:142-1749(+)
MGKNGAWSRGPYTEWISLPNVKVKDFIANNVSDKLSGPTANGQVEKYSNLIAGRSLSTYPSGFGEPNCDRFSVEILDTRAILCLADGCGWGPKSREAAHRASAAYMEYINQTLQTIVDIREAGRCILRAFQKAHMKIVEGYEDVGQSGNTTLVGGIIMELVEDDETQAQLKELGIDAQHINTTYTFAKEDSSAVLKIKNLSSDSNEALQTSLPPYKWIFICASVGDCKAFHYSAHTKQFTDVTAGNRTNLLDAKDPGGRLGPDENGLPAADLRNLALYFMPCHAEDVIILVSDGVHDNLDPQSLGIPPTVLGMNSDNWYDAEKTDSEKTDQVKTEFRNQIMKAVLESGGATFTTLQPECLTSNLLDYSYQVTVSSREWMETNTKRLPDDYVLYPGKMDHSTCLAMVVGGKTLENTFGKVEITKTSNQYDAIPKVNGTSDPNRRLSVFGMDKELLIELSITPSDTISTVIEIIKEDLDTVICGRAFRLKKSDISFSTRPVPIVKNQFATRVYDFFPSSSGIIVLQFGSPPEPKRTG